MSDPVLLLTLAGAFVIALGVTLGAIKLFERWRR